MAQRSYYIEERSAESLWCWISLFPILGSAIAIILPIYAILYGENLGWMEWLFALIWAPIVGLGIGLGLPAAAWKELQRRKDAASLGVVTAGKVYRVEVEFHETDQHDSKPSPCLKGAEGNYYRPHLRVVGSDGERLAIAFLDGPAGPVPRNVPIPARIQGVCGSDGDFGVLVTGAEFEILEGSRVVGKGRRV